MITASLLADLPKEFPQIHVLSTRQSPNGNRTVQATRKFQLGLKYKLSSGYPFTALDLCLQCTRQNHSDTKLSTLGLQYETVATVELVTPRLNKNALPFAASEWHHKKLNSKLVRGESGSRKLGLCNVCIIKDDTDYK